MKTWKIIFFIFFITLHTHETLKDFFYKEDLHLLYWKEENIYQTSLDINFRDYCFRVKYWDELLEKVGIDRKEDFFVPIK